MKYLVYLFSGINLYAGIWFLLNAFGILQTSKYSNGANVFFAITLTIAGLTAFYVSIAKGATTQALLIDLGPWVITLTLLVGNMLLGDYK